MPHLRDGRGSSGAGSGCYARRTRGTGSVRRRRHHAVLHTQPLLLTNPLLLVSNSKNRAKKGRVLGIEREGKSHGSRRTLRLLERSRSTLRQTRLRDAVHRRTRHVPAITQVYLF